MATTKTKTKLLSLFTVLTLLFTMFVLPTPTSAETPAEKYKRLKDELANIDKQVEQYKGDIAEAEQYREKLKDQKAYYEELIFVKKQQILETQTKLALKQEEVAVKRQEVYENDQLYQQRLVAMYKTNNASALSTVLNVDNFSDLFIAIDALQRIAQHDTDLLELLETQRAELEAQQVQIAEMAAQLEKDHQELEDIEQKLAVNIQAQDTKITEAQAAMQAQQAIYDDKAAEAEKAHQDMIEESKKVPPTATRPGDGSQYIGGVFTWPVPSCYTTSCNFRERDPAGKPHRGMDIPGARGSTIVAVGNGTVIKSQLGESYGYFIQIDHGNGLTSLYAHCSALWVGVGEYVTTGQPIAAVGSTGFSTGPHLHLEIAIGSELQDPRNYFIA